MKRIPTSSTKISKAILLVFLAYNPAFSQEQSGIFFDLNNQPLTSVLDTMIDQYDVSVVYQDNFLKDVNISAQCNDCSPDEAIAVLLDRSGLKWTKRNNQYIIVTEKGWDEPYSITGYVKDGETGESIHHANISIQNTYTGTVSNENGFFNIPGVETNICTLMISYIGYELMTLPVQKRNVKNTLLNIFIKPTMITTEDINVTGSQIDIMKMGERISQISYSPRNVAMLPNLGENDVIRSLQLLPGIQSGNAGSAGLYIRGGTPDQNQIILDGMTLYQMDHFFGFVSSINSQAIKDIQVYKGGIPARYGGRINSVIEMTGKHGDMNQSRFSVYTNQISNGFSIQQPFFKRGSFLITHRRTFTDQYRSYFYEKIHNYLSDGSELNIGQEVILKDSTASQDYSPSFSFMDQNAKVIFMPTKQNVISVSYYASEDHLKEQSQFDFENSLYNKYQQKDVTEWMNKGASIRLSHQWKNGSYSQFMYSQTNYNSDHVKSIYSEYDLYDSTIIYDEYLSEDNEINDVTFHLNHDWQIKDNQLQSGIWFSQYATDFNVHQSGDISLIDRNISRDVISVYFQDRMNIMNRGTLDIGLRTSKYSKVQKGYFLPRVALRYELSQSSRFLASWGKHVQYLHRFSNDFISSGSKFVWLLSADSLKIAESEQFILGYQRTFDRLEMNIELYSNEKSNIPNFSVLHHYPNNLYPADAYNSGLLMQGDESSKGIELLLKRTKGPVIGWISYNYGISEWTFNELNGSSAFKANHDRTHDLKTIVMTNIGSWQWTFSWMLFSGTSFTNTDHLSVLEDDIGNVSLISESGFHNRSRLPDSHRLDISVMRSSLWKGYIWEYGLSIFNVYNNKYISHKRYSFASVDTDILVNDVKVMGITPTLFFRISR